MRLPSYRDLPLSTKLTLLTTFLCTVAVGLACLAFIAWDVETYKRQLVTEVGTLADVVGSNSAAAMVFDDPVTARSTLRGLATASQVRSATLLRPDGTTFMEYGRSLHREGSAQRLAIGEHQYQGEVLVLRREIRDRGEVVGSIVIRAELDALHQRLASIGMLGLIVLACTLVASLVLAAAISSTLARPLRQLSETARKVTTRRDWSVRVHSPYGDEIGQLARAFDEMMDVTQGHQVELTGARRELETRVEQLRHEIAERERAQQALQRSEELLVQAQKMEAVGKLAGGVAHDFNNILTAIRGYSEMVLARLDPTTQEWRRVNEVLKASQRAASLTGQLLAFGRKQMLAPRVLDLSEVVQQMQRMLERIIGADVDLVMVRRFGVGNVRADRSQVEQVVMNLVVNARDAMPRGGRITIELSNAVLDEHYAATHMEVVPGRYVLMSVTDEGTGIDKEALPHIFEPFFTTKEQGKGTGLGLATVYGIVKQSGGHLAVYSEAGRGATFNVYLPLVTVAVESETPSGARLELRGTERVMLVEDEPQLRELLSEALTERGFDVLLAGDLREAERVLDGHIATVDILITDVVMPGGTGRELADLVHARRPGLPVLFVSGYSESAIVHRGVLEPGIEFLQKPFSPAQLVERVRQVLGPARSDRAA